MAPKRKPRDANNSIAAGTRVTRSSARLAKAAVAPPLADPQPRKRKKAKTTAAAAVKKEAETEIKSPAKTTASAAAAKEEVETETESPPSPADQEPKTVDSSKTIIVEHCKQCNSFKTRAIQVKLGLEKGVAGVKVLVNPEKPRRGCFEIREKGGGIFVSLLDLKRPFKPMKDLDMEKVISDIVERIRH